MMSPDDVERLIEVIGSLAPAVTALFAFYAGYRVGRGT